MFKLLLLVLFYVNWLIKCQFVPCLDGVRQCDLDILYRRYFVEDDESNKTSEIQNYFDSIGKTDNRDTIPWRLARDFCEQWIGTELAIIRSPEEQVMAHDVAEFGFAKEQGKNAWIGLYTISDEYGRLPNTNPIKTRPRNWTWATSEELTLKDTNYTGWCDTGSGLGEPSSGRAKRGIARASAEDCVMLRASAGCDYDWNDANCTGKDPNAEAKAVLCTNPAYDPDRACLCNCEGCYGEGDPHVTTFDGLLFHPMNPCIYKYVSSCTGDYSGRSGMPFEVSVRHDKCFREDRACVSEVVIKFYDWNGTLTSKLYINDGGDIRDEFGNIPQRDEFLCTDNNFSVNAEPDFDNCNNISNPEIIWRYNSAGLPSHIDIRILFTDKQSGNVTGMNREFYDARILIAREFGQPWKPGNDEVGFEAWVHVHLSKCWEDKACGVCGRYDGDVINEFTSFAGINTDAYFTVFNNGASLVTDIGGVTPEVQSEQNLFVDSWLDEDEVKKADCTPAPTPPPTPCYNRTERICDKQGCDCPKDPNYGTAWVQICVIDLCAATDDELVCEQKFGSDYDLETCYQNEGLLEVVNNICLTHCGDLADTPTHSPTVRPTPGPSTSPTEFPTRSPITESPTQAPTTAPTVSPTSSPTPVPTQAPTSTPSKDPSQAPSRTPTETPTKFPTLTPTKFPTKAPSAHPTKPPTTANPTKSPTIQPTSNYCVLDVGNGESVSSGVTLPVSDEAVDNRMDSIGVRMLLVVKGSNPRTMNPLVTPFVGQIIMTAMDDDIDLEYLVDCDGRTLNKNDFPLLYDLLTDDGTIFPWGDDSGDLFFTPDCRDKVLVGSNADGDDIGYNNGNNLVSKDNLIVDHIHNVFDFELNATNSDCQNLMSKRAEFDVTFTDEVIPSGDTIFNNEQEGVIVNMLIVGRNAQNPNNRDFNVSDLIVGELVLFAGYISLGGNDDFIRCDGETKVQGQFEDLFGIYEDSWGVANPSRFVTPNCVGRVLRHSPDFSRLDGGSNTITLDENNIPRHSHLPPVRFSLGCNALITNLTEFGVENCADYNNAMPWIASKFAFPVYGNDESQNGRFDGSISIFTSNNLPSPFVLPGTSVDDTSYPELVRAISQSISGGLNTFNLPDFDNRVAYDTGNNLDIGQNIGSRVIDCDSSSLVDHVHVVDLFCDSASPTRTPTLTPSANPTTEPTRTPTSNPSLTPSKYPSEFPSIDPSETPTETPTLIPSKSPSANPTNDPTENPSTHPSESPSAEPSNNPTTTPTTNPTENPSKHPSTHPSKHPSTEPSSDPTQTPTTHPSKHPSTEPTSDPTLTPSKYPSESPSAEPSNNPTATPSENPTENPTVQPTSSPSKSPSANPSITPTEDPTVNPSSSPSLDPTENPSGIPTKSPSLSPSNDPTDLPTKFPSANPSKSPSNDPTENPTSDPTVHPSKSPSETPTELPTVHPSKSPSGIPTESPSKSPTANPSSDPTVNPSNNPTDSPSKFPSDSPSKSPSEIPTEIPSKTPTGIPTTDPTVNPSETPTKQPSKFPSEIPSRSPTNNPSKVPSKSPSVNPTEIPTKSPSKFPTEDPSEEPTTYPSEVPTEAPSKPPSESPTVNPTKLPSRTPTDAPTVQKCDCLCEGNIQCLTLKNNGQTMNIKVSDSLDITLFNSRVISGDSFEFCDMDRAVYISTDINGDGIKNGEDSRRARLRTNCQDDIYIGLVIMPTMDRFAIGSDIHDLGGMGSFALEVTGGMDIRNTTLCKFPENEFEDIFGFATSECDSTEGLTTTLTSDGLTTTDPENETDGFDNSSDDVTSIDDDVSDDENDGTDDDNTTERGTTTPRENDGTSDDRTSPDDDINDDENDGTDDDDTTRVGTTTLSTLENEISSDDNTSPDDDITDDENDSTDDDFTTKTTSTTPNDITSDENTSPDDDVTDDENDGVDDDDTTNPTTTDTLNRSTTTQAENDVSSDEGTTPDDDILDDENDGLDDDMTTEVSSTTLRENDYSSDDDTSDDAITTASLPPVDLTTTNTIAGLTTTDPDLETDGADNTSDDVTSPDDDARDDENDGIDDDFTTEIDTTTRGENELSSDDNTSPDDDNPDNGNDALDDDEGVTTFMGTTTLGEDDISSDDETSRDDDAPDDENDSTDDDNASTTLVDCSNCRGSVSTLTFKNTGRSGEYKMTSNNEIIFNGNIPADTMITFSGNNVNSEFPNNIVISVGGMDTTLVTDCSESIRIGDILDLHNTTNYELTIVYGESSRGGKLCGDVINDGGTTTNPELETDGYDMSSDDVTSPDDDLIDDENDGIDDDLTTGKTTTAGENDITSDDDTSPDDDLADDENDGINDDVTTDPSSDDVTSPDDNAPDDVNDGMDDDFTTKTGFTTTLGENDVTSDDDTSPDDDVRDDVNDGNDDDITTNGLTTTVGENDLSSDDMTSPDDDLNDDENDGFGDDSTTDPSSDDVTSPDDDLPDDVNDGTDDDFTTRFDDDTTTIGENDKSSDDETSPDDDINDDENDGVNDDFTTDPSSDDVTSPDDDTPDDVNDGTDDDFTTPENGTIADSTTDSDGLTSVDCECACQGDVTQLVFHNNGPNNIECVVIKDFYGNELFNGGILNDDAISISSFDIDMTLGDYISFNDCDNDNMISTLDTSCRTAIYVGVTVSVNGNVLEILDGESSMGGELCDVNYVELWGCLPEASLAPTVNPTLSPTRECIDCLCSGGVTKLTLRNDGPDRYCYFGCGLSNCKATDRLSNSNRRLLWGYVCEPRKVLVKQNDTIDLTKMIGKEFVCEGNIVEKKISKHHDYGDDRRLLSGGNTQCKCPEPFDCRRRLAYHNDDEMTCMCKEFINIKIDFSCTQEMFIGKYLKSGFSVVGGSSKHNGELCPYNDRNYFKRCPEDCGCIGRISSLTFLNEGGSKRCDVNTGHKGSSGSFFVNKGETFTVAGLYGKYTKITCYLGALNNGKMGENEKIDSSLTQMSEIHTSCSSPVFINLVLKSVDLVIVDGASRRGRPLCVGDRMSQDW